MIRRSASMGGRRGSGGAGGRRGSAGALWAARSLRLRVTVASTTVLALGLILGTVALVALFGHGRIAAIDVRLRAETTTLVGLLRSGQLSAPLPEPQASPLLAQVLDPAGTVLAATPSASRVLSLLPLRELSAAGTAVRVSTVRDSSAGPAALRVAVVRTELAGNPVTVVVAAPLADVENTLHALGRVVVVVVPLLLIAVALATWAAVSSALRPVDEMRAAADAVVDTPGGSGPRLPVPATRDELSRLAETFNRALGRLHESAERQRRFVADAAHELRSPLAVATTELELAVADPPDAPGWISTAEGVLDEVSRLSRLVDDLLLLARLDAGPPPGRGPIERSAVDLAALGAVAGGGVAGPPVLVTGDPLALRRAVENLVANARRHAHATVTVSVYADGADAVLVVDDDGPGVPAPDRERVFDRWTRLDEARARDAGGAGLGLAIARAVARAHGGDVTLTESPLGGARAELRLPVRAP